ncbi:TonB-dependent receptor domain-containing protein, partial [Xanthomonas hortorum]|uniref:TonB-dependent receptor domain-containing protein n=1 Tax=Xanthomonas hortorum TaxID=56454 RepID=UPI003F2126E4
ADVLSKEIGVLVVVHILYQLGDGPPTSGVGLDFHPCCPTEAAGNFGLNTAYTHVRDYRRPTVVGGPLQDYAGSNLGPSLPRNKATTTLDWNLGTVSAALTWYYTGGYDQKASAAASALQSRVDDYNQFDLYLAYTGIDTLTLYAKIENLADKQPPVDASFPGIRAPYDFTQYDLRGRYFTVGLDYRF